MPQKNSNSKKLSQFEIVYSRLKRRFLKNIWFARGVVIAGILIILFGIFLLIRGVVARSPLGQFVEPAKNFIFTSSGSVDSTDGRTNVLVLGRGGEGHEAPELTDTIMFGSVSSSSKKATIISLPRDIWIDSLSAKINSAYYWGNKKQAGGGLILAKSTVSEVIGQPVHYAVIIDFSGFKRIIDTLGGVEVEVPSSFTDNKFPIPGKETEDCPEEARLPDSQKVYPCRYESISFTKGKTFMDGETALKFVRSRHAEGDDGTDFARAERQQALLNGIKTKVLTSGILFNPQKLEELVKVGESVIETDIPKESSGVLARFGFDARDSISSHVLGEELLINPPIQAKYQNQYVFIPKGGNWNQIHEWVNSILP